MSRRSVLTPVSDRDLLDLPKEALLDVLYAKKLEKLISVFRKHGIVLAKKADSRRGRRMCYFVYDRQSDEGVAFVVGSRQEALDVRVRVAGELDVDFIDMGARRLKNVDVSGLSFGELDPIEGLKRGAYAWADGDCPVCEEYRELQRVMDGLIMCSDCEAEQYD